MCLSLVKVGFNIQPSEYATVSQIHTIHMFGLLDVWTLLREQQLRARGLGILTPSEHATVSEIHNIHMFRCLNAPEA